MRPPPASFEREGEECDVLLLEGYGEKGQKHAQIEEEENWKKEDLYIMYLVFIL